MVKRRETVIGILLLAAAAWHVVAVAEESPYALYLREIKPVLKARCFACHGALQQQAELRLDTAARILQGGQSGSAIATSTPESSLLLQKVTAAAADGRMPPEGEPLTEAQIASLRQWIAAGAPAPTNETPESDPRDHWSFRAPVRPQIVSLPNGQLAANPIDALLAAQWSKTGVQPVGPAEKHALLRRIYLDLMGLPPTIEQLHSFLADDSPMAYEAVVDRLLSDPRYGERWGRHWMDVWRYSDWFGRRHVPDVWNSAPQIWRWRDWIIRSLNEDRGYDQMVTEMLAADEVASEDDAACHATGYLIRNWYALNPNDWMRSTVEHTGKAFLGLTFNCAHCHDHKYDPIAQDDYFRMRAFFEPIYVRQDQVPGEADPGPFQDYNYSTLRKVQRLGAVRVFDKNIDAPTWFYTGGDERNRVTDRSPLTPGVPKFLSEFLPTIEPVNLPPRAWYPGLRLALQQSLLDEAKRGLANAEKEASAAAIESVPDVTILQQLAIAEADYEAAVNAAQMAGVPGALAGRNSLYLDATTGRRILHHDCQQLTTLPDGMLVEFEWSILSDTHVNFQFAKDISKGLTAAYVGFEKGRILSYQPGSFTEFEVGKYDSAAEPRRFHMTLLLQTQADRCLLTVREHGKETPLVADVPVALNGWNPIGDRTKGITFDARPGSRLLIDGIQFSTIADDGAKVPQFTIDFESPKYEESADVVGRDGWSAASLSVAPATSIVSATAGNSTLRAAAEKVATVRRALRVPELPRLTATAKVTAARSALASLEARLAADRAKYGELPGVDTATLTTTAGLLERQASLHRAEADALVAESALAQAEALPDDDKDRAKKLADANKGLTAAQDQLTRAKAAMTANVEPAAYTAFSPTYPATSTGRRRALAEWITSRENPLTARVAVNHIWGRHFHSPIVATVFDFGRNGAAPTHPELLDWLAVEFMDSGWSMKHLHRLILTSQAYRMSSTDTQISAEVRNENGTRDPENRSLWRMNAGRMEAEVLRDSLLHCALSLDFRMYGQELENDVALTTFRRSLYYSCNPELDGKSQFGALFDAPEASECYRRTRTVVPQQALALTNSELVHRVSQSVVLQWEEMNTTAESAAPEPFISAMFEQLLSRPPSAAELAACRQGYDSICDADAASPSKRKARETIVRVLLNHNDFLTIR